MPRTRFEKLGDRLFNAEWRYSSPPHRDDVSETELAARKHAAMTIRNLRFAYDAFVELIYSAMTREDFRRYRELTEMYARLTAPIASNAWTIHQLQAAETITADMLRECGLALDDVLPRSERDEAPASISLRRSLGTAVEQFSPGMTFPYKRRVREDTRGRPQHGTKPAAIHASYEGPNQIRVADGRLLPCRANILPTADELDAETSRVLQVVRRSRSRKGLDLATIRARLKLRESEVRESLRELCDRGLVRCEEDGRKKRYFARNV